MAILSFERFLNESVGMDVDSIVYGNPTAELHMIETRPNDIKDWFIRNGHAETIIRECPKNSGQTTQADLQEVLRKMENASDVDIAFAKAAEDSLVKTFVDFIIDKGHTATETECNAIVEQTDPLLFFLKNAINRPRPYQLAHTLDLPLYPLIHTNANSAAYPSGHAYDSYNIARYFAQKYPDIAEDCMDFAEKIAETRIYTGIHYPSDNRVSKKISDMLWENNLLDHA